MLLQKIICFNEKLFFINSYDKIKKEEIVKAVIQRVKSAELKVDGKLISKIGQGLVVYFCVEKDDDEGLISYFSNKIGNLRIFSDAFGKMNLSVKDVGGEILLISQFTLAGDASHGFRPSFTTAETPERANKIYLLLASELNKTAPTKTGVFGADMQILQENYGPVTIILERKEK